MIYGGTRHILAYCEIFSEIPGVSIFSDKLLWHIRTSLTPNFPSLISPQTKKHWIGILHGQTLSEENYSFFCPIKRKDKINNGNGIFGKKVIEKRNYWEFNQNLNRVNTSFMFHENIEFPLIAMTISDFINVTKMPENFILGYPSFVLVLIGIFVQYESFLISISSIIRALIDGFHELFLELFWSRCAEKSAHRFAIKILEITKNLTKWKIN